MEHRMIDNLSFFDDSIQFDEDAELLRSQRSPSRMPAPFVVARDCVLKREDLEAVRWREHPGGILWSERPALKTRQVLS